jgi:hypothetical protein
MTQRVATQHVDCGLSLAFLQVIYGAQKLDTCSMDSMDLGPNSNKLGVMITLRMRLQCAIVRSGHSQPEQVYEVLNEIVVDRGSNSFLTNIEAYIGGRFITRVQVGWAGGPVGTCRLQPTVCAWILPCWVVRVSAVYAADKLLYTCVEHAFMQTAQIGRQAQRQDFQMNL